MYEKMCLNCEHVWHTDNPGHNDLCPECGCPDVTTEAVVDGSYEGTFNTISAGNEIE